MKYEIILPVVSLIRITKFVKALDALLSVERSALKRAKVEDY